MSINIDLMRRLERNQRDNLIAAIGIFLKLTSNILANPQDEKYRKFKKNNPRIAKELLSIDGMREMLIESGFVETSEEFVMQRGGIGVITKLKTYHEFLKLRVEDLKKAPTPVVNPTTGTRSKVSEPVTKTISIAASKPFHERIKFPQVLRTSNEFLRTLEHLSDSVMQYEDPVLQQSALKIIPTEKLRLQATEKLRKIQKLIIKGEIADPEPILDDLILEELAAWFKNDFFTWINSAPCYKCANVNTQPMGTYSSAGVRVEKYFCTLNGCNSTTEFARYNDIAKLLVTRAGRCGEYANCFTFLCQCLGYDARYIYCTADHVWTEVYNHTKKRWIHVDPSENVFDSPLMYEAGWKRNIEYVLAFARDDVQDVTWRYTSRHGEIKNRKMCSEGELVQAIMQLRKKRQLNSSKARKKFMDLRTLAELAELMIERQPTEDERRGRTSGSLSWRLERGETNAASFYVFNLNDDEKAAREFNIRYSCAKNSFQRVVKSEVVDSTGDWSHWLHSVENIFRKVEHDHKMVYLARTEESTSGWFKMSFDFGDDVRIESVDLKLDLTTFHTGKAELKFLDGSDRPVGRQELRGKSRFSIKVHVSGGVGDCAWQHAQIFRQKLGSDEFPFQMNVRF